MATGFQIKCGKCGFGFDAWGDGNPYFRAEDGTKIFWHHPEQEPYEGFVRSRIGSPGDFGNPAEYLKARTEVLKGRLGNEADSLCRDCGELCRIDSEAVDPRCPACGSKELVDTFEALNIRCPKCKVGMLKEVGGMIS